MANKNIYATVPKPGTLDQAIKYALDDLKIRVPLALMLLSTLPSRLAKATRSWSRRQVFLSRLCPKAP